MCICGEVLRSPMSEKELRFVRPDRPRLVLGNGKPMLFQIIFIADATLGREVTLSCDCCGARFVTAINGRYSVTPLK